MDSGTDGSAGLVVGGGRGCGAGAWLGGRWAGEGAIEGATWGLSTAAGGLGEEYVGVGGGRDDGMGELARGKTGVGANRGGNISGAGA